MLRSGFRFGSLFRLFPIFIPFAALTLLLIVFDRTAQAEQPKMRAVFNKSTGRADLLEGKQIVLSYNYHTVLPPKGLLEKVHANSQKYAQPRSNYIHPLYGPDGEILTEDWAVDHPHHRGVYWAWPEVDYQGERGDLHALQDVFARPTGKIETRSGAGFSEIEAENKWMWKDKTAIVNEVVTIRTYPAQNNGRFIDLKFSFTAIQDDVSIARRKTELYGGLNFRLSPVRDLEIITHTDPESSTPQMAWGDSLGIRPGGSKRVGVGIIEKQTNPQYPGQWMEYPNLPWFQPTFPNAGNRYVLKQGKPLVLKYRLWIRHGGKLDHSEYGKQWSNFQKVKKN